MVRSVGAVVTLRGDEAWQTSHPIMASYGQMKLGGRSAIDGYARLLTGVVREWSDAGGEDEDLLVASTPRGAVPSASNLLASAVVAELETAAPHARLRPLVIARRPRSVVLPRHYASLSPDARALRLSHELENWSVEDDVRGRNVLVMDDVRATGAHERAVDDFLRREGARAVDFQYLARFLPPVGEDADEVETALNLIGVSTDRQFLEFLRADQFTVTTRLLWRLIELPDEMFELALRVTHHQKLADVLSGIGSEGVPSREVTRRSVITGPSAESRQATSYVCAWSWHVIATGRSESAPTSTPTTSPARRGE